MKFRPWLRVRVLLVMWGMWLCSATLAANERVPILVDTDIGSDIDDAFALGLALGSQELEVRGITTVGSDAQKRAMMVCRFLTVTGRRHTPVAFGAKPQPMRPITDLYKYYYHPDVLFDRTKKPEKQSASDFLYRRLKQQPGKITVLALGSLTNLAHLFQTHADSPSLIHRIVALESNLALDPDATKKVQSAKVPLLIVSRKACRGLTLDKAGAKSVFAPGTALSRQVETMYQMWDRTDPPLGETLAVALCFDERFANVEQRAKDRFVTSVKTEAFVRWYTNRMASLVSPAQKPSRLIENDGMPNRVHVSEDFDNDIERFWWMSGKPETTLLPPGSRRACRGVLTHDFDDLLMASRQMYAAVIFNPVPGPPMGKRTRLRFRYWLAGTDTIRVQIYSLTNGYHRQLVVKRLPQKRWQLATVDMTEARRPDGTGGPLSENERIDDIQFYIDPNAEVVIDDIVLYDAPGEGEQRPFPKRIHFAGVFDTGKQGQHWPGDFDLVADAGNFWRAVRSVTNPKTGEPWIRLGLRGQRTLGAKTQVAFRYRTMNADSLQVRLLDTKTGMNRTAKATQLKRGKWSQTTVEFDTNELPSIDEIQVLLPKGTDLLLDDLLLYEPAE